ncbi:hypothetical protein ACHAWF_004558 [Thalassiosira exigua]
MTKTRYCAIGFGENFFYPLGSDALAIPERLLLRGEAEGEGSAVDAGPRLDGEGNGEPDRATKRAEEGAIRARLVALNPGAGSGGPVGDDDGRSSSAREWIRSRLDERPEYVASRPPRAACGATHTSVIVPPPGGSSSSSSTSGGAEAAGEVHLMGTIFGRTHPTLTIQPVRLPLRIARISSGRRHVLALTEGASPPGGGGGGGGGGGSAGAGGAVLSWGAGHFGQLGHGPDLTSCREPRVVERLLPHAVGGGSVIDVAAGGLHSLAIVAVGRRSGGTTTATATTATTNGSKSDASVPTLARETRTFAWGSNRKGQCGVEGGKCATVPEPLPVVSPLRRGENHRGSKGGGGGGGGDSTASAESVVDPVDKNVHFEKVACGRLHTVALTAYGEVFAWGSTSMGRCGHGASTGDSSSRSGGGGSGSGGDRRLVQRPRHVSALKNVVVEEVAAGTGHTLALSRGGRVFAWGAGGDGQCGQGHAGNLFAPRAVKGLPGGDDAGGGGGGGKRRSSGGDGAKDGSGGGGGGMPHVESRVAMEVALEEEALSKALSASRIGDSSPGEPSTATATMTTGRRPEPRPDRVVKIRASGCYSAAITSRGDIYTWGYGGGPALGHPVPPEESLPLIPLVEGNQYSTSTAAKVFPAGGSEDNRIRDCRCFDTDLNVMLPRKVECIGALGLRVEDAALGPSHMVALCSAAGEGPDDVDDGTSGEARARRSAADATRDSEDADGDGGGEGNFAGGAAPRQGSSPPSRGFELEADATREGAPPPGAGEPPADAGERPTDKRRRSPGWMTRMKSSSRRRFFKVPR